MNIDYKEQKIFLFQNKFYFVHLEIIKVFSYKNITIYNKQWFPLYVNKLSNKVGDLILKKQGWQHKYVANSLKF